MQGPGQQLTNHLVGRLSDHGNAWARRGWGESGQVLRTLFFKGGEQVSAPLRTVATIRVKTRYTCYLQP